MEDVLINYIIFIGLAILMIVDIVDIAEHDMTTRCPECGHTMLEEVVYMYNIIPTVRKRCINCKCKNYKPWTSSTIYKE